MSVTVHQTSEQLSRALGEAVVKLWSRLPQDIQHALFEEAATRRGEAIRPQLAVFLHDITRAPAPRWRRAPCWSRIVWAGDERVCCSNVRKLGPGSRHSASKTRVNAR